MGGVYQGGACSGISDRTDCYPTARHCYICELYKGPQDDPVMPKLMQGLKDKGLIYYDARIDGRAVISNIRSKRQNASTNGCSKRFWMSMGNEWPFTRHIQSIVTTPVTIPGYNDGSVNWDKLPAPITDVNKILAVCEESDRIESAQALSTTLPKS